MNEVVWQGYSGAARSKLTNGQMTRIIISMLEAAHLDPNTHVKQLHLVQENDNDDRNVGAAHVVEEQVEADVGNADNVIDAGEQIIQIVENRNIDVEEVIEDEVEAEHVNGDNINIAVVKKRNVEQRRLLRNKLRLKLPMVIS